MNQPQKSLYWPTSQYHDLVTFQAMTLMQLQTVLAQRDAELAQLRELMAEAKARAERAEGELIAVRAMLREEGPQP